MSSLIEILVLPFNSQVSLSILCNNLDNVSPTVSPYFERCFISSLVLFDILIVFIIYCFVLSDIYTLCVSPQNSANTTPRTVWGQRKLHRCLMVLVLFDCCCFLRNFYEKVLRKIFTSFFYQFFLRKIFTNFFYEKSTGNVQTQQLNPRSSQMLLTSKAIFGGFL